MILRQVLLIAALMMAHAVFADTVSEKRKMILVEDALELNSLKIALDDGQNGFVMDNKERFAITPETRAIEDGAVVPLIRAKERLGKSALVLYDIKSRKVTKIIWTTR